MIAAAIVASALLICLVFSKDFRGVFIRLATYGAVVALSAVWFAMMYFFTYATNWIKQVTNMPAPAVKVGYVVAWSILVSGALHWLAASIHRALYPIIYWSLAAVLVYVKWDQSAVVATYHHWIDYTKSDPLVGMTVDIVVGCIVVGFLWLIVTTIGVFIDDWSNRIWPPKPTKPPKVRPPP